MTLRYLDFDCSDDTDGWVTWEAMASVSQSQWPALQAEVAQVLDWAHRDFAGVRGPLDEDGDWDYDLQGMQEALAPLALAYDEAERHLHAPVEPDVTLRYTLTLTLSGTAAFGEALRTWLVSAD